MKVGVFGASGRVGKLLIEVLKQHQECHLSVVFIRKEVDFILPRDCIATDKIEDFIRECELVIDFSLPDATNKLVRFLLKNPKPLVCGTTGLSAETLNSLKELAHFTPVLYATNMSRGIAILNLAIAMVARNFSDADIEICEIHHRNKKDAPSGTALTLAQTCAEARGLELDQCRISGRDGNIGARQKDTIAVMSLRGGDIAGKHTVGFYVDGEYLEFSHHATSRLTFAKGAIDAAIWLFKQNIGMYHIKDMFQL